MNNNLKCVVLGALLALACSANAGIYEGYRMITASVEDTKWVVNRGALSLADGALVYDLGANNASSAYNRWGADAWELPNAENDETDNILVSFDFKVKTGDDVSTNSPDAAGVVTYKQQNWGLVVTSADESSYVWSISRWSGGADWIFMLSEVTDAAVNANPLSLPVFSVGGTDKNVALDVSKFYSISVVVNAVSRTAKYVISDTEAASVVAEGSYDLPEDVSPFSTGLFVSPNKSGGFSCKDLVVGKLVDGHVANVPKSKLAKVQGESRGYSLWCSPGESIHVQGVEGVRIADHNGNAVPEVVFSYDDVKVNKNIVYVLDSGDVEMWTENGDQKSKSVFFKADCGAVKLPVPVATLVGFGDGFKKTYQVTVDNSTVLTNPDIKLSYRYGNGNVVLAAEEGLSSGSQISLENAGVLKVKACLAGFVDSDELLIVNDKFYEVKTDLDFEHMTLDDDLAPKGFVALAPIYGTSTSGENNWASSKRFYDYVVMDKESEPVQVFLPAGVYDVSQNVINRWEWQVGGRAALLNEIDSEQAMLFAPLMFANRELSYSKANTIQIKEGVGLLNNETAQTYVPYYFRGLDDDDVSVVYTIGGYGTNSIHGVFSSVEEARATHHGVISDVVKGNGTFSLYRVDTSISRIVVFSRNSSKDAQLSSFVDNPDALGRYAQVHMYVVGTSAHFMNKIVLGSDFSVAVSVEAGTQIDCVMLNGKDVTEDALGAQGKICLGNVHSDQVIIVVPEGEEKPTSGDDVCALPFQAWKCDNVIYAEATEATSVINIYDLAGRLLYSVSPSKYGVLTFNVSKGVHIITYVQQDGSMWSKKL